MIIRFTAPILLLLLLACEMPTPTPGQPSTPSPTPTASSTPLSGNVADVQLAHPEGLYNGNLRDWRGRAESQTLYFLVQGTVSGGTVWGSGVYTDDSHLGTAAVHAGLLKPGETGIVMVTMLPGQKSYSGASAHGVTSRNYGSWPGSFRFTGTVASEGSPTHNAEVNLPIRTAVLSTSGNLTNYRGQFEQLLRFEVQASSQGTVWGSDIYTDDSALAAAVLHAGLLQAGERGIVTVQMLPGQASYEGVNRHGVQSRSYGSWSGSYRFIGPAQKLP